MANDTKSRVIEAAKPLFAKYGFKKTSVQDIARAAHVAKGAMYYYFKSKDEVFEAIVHDELSTLWNRVIEAVNAVTTPEEKIRSFVLTRMKETERLLNAFAALENEEIEHLGFIDEVRRRALKQQTGVVAGILEDGIEGGVFRRLDSKAVAEMMILALAALDQLRREGRSWKETSKRLDEMLGMLFDGIRSK